MFYKKYSAFLSILSLLVVSTSWAAPAKILPLGDSITADGGNSAYRNELFDKLKAAGYDFEFVGSETDYDYDDLLADKKTSTFGTKHEGHSGWKADEIGSSLSGWLNGYVPDIALIHLGTNDIIQGDTVESTLDDLKGITGKLQENNANVSIFIAKIIPLRTPDESGPLNNKLTDDWAGDVSTSGSSVKIVDQHSAVTSPADYHDNPPIHLNRAGEEKMAQKWFDALVASALIPPKLTLTSPVTTTGGASFTVSASSTALPASSGAISFSTTSTGVCAINPTTGDVTPQATGNCEIIATQGEVTSKYAEATSNMVSIAVTGSPQKLVFDDITPPPTYGDLPFSVKATSFNTHTPATQTGLTAQLKSLTTSVCSYSSSTKKVTILKAGQCTLEATQTGGVVGTGANSIIYAEATPVTKSITIKKAEQNITFIIEPPLNKTFGDAPFGVTATSFNTKNSPVATGLTVNIGTTTANVCTYDTGSKKVTIKSAGMCTLKAVQTGDNNYKAKTETIDIMISAKGQTISFPNITDKVINNGPFDISATASSALPVSFLSTTTNVCTVDNQTVTLVAVGTCRITATAGNSNNNTASATREFEVIKASQTVAFDNDTPTTKTNKDSAFTVSAISTSNLVVTIKSLSKSICTVGANYKVSIHLAGNCILKAEQSGNAIYNAATATHTIVISAIDTTYDTVVEIINSNGTAKTTTAQLKAIGLKNINADFDYTKALKNGTYKNKSKPTIVELQKAIDNENNAEIKTAGSAPITGLMLLGFMALYRRKPHTVVKRIRSSL